MYIFDGVNKIITLTLGVISLDVQDMYSRWKEWVQIGDNSKFDPAFDNSVGGEPLGGGQSIGSYFFIQNGWLIRPQEADHTLNVFGNLLPVPETAPLFTATLGGFQVNIVMIRSANSQSVETGVSGLTPEESVQLAEIDNLKTRQGVINDGIKKASLIVPHTTDLPE